MSVLFAACLAWSPGGLDAQEPAAEVPAQLSAEEVSEALRITEDMLQIRDSIEVVLQARDTLVGARLQVQTSRVRGLLDRASELQQALIDLFPTTSVEAPLVAETDTVAASPDVSEELGLIRSRIQDYTLWLQTAYRVQREEYVSELDRLSAIRGDASADSAVIIDSESRLLRGRVDTLFVLEAELLTNSEALGVEVSDAWRGLEQAGIAWADGLMGRLQLAQIDEEALRQDLDDAERAGFSDAEIARIRNQVQSVERLIDDLSATLTSAADFLDARGFETAGYRRIVIETTGVTGDILDRDVLGGLLSDMIRDSVEWIRTQGPTILIRVGIVVLFGFIGRFGAKLVWWVIPAIRLVQLPRLASQLIGGILGPLGTLVGLGFGLSLIGVDATTLVAGAGVAGLVLGFAMQDSISNFAAGFLILLYRPFDQDDVIEAAGVVGRVRSMGLANTTLVTFDNRKLSIPNSTLWGTVIANRSSEPTRRAETVLRVAFDQDLNRVFEVVRGCLAENDLVLDEPAPTVYVSRAGDSWLEVKVWAWTENANWWAVTSGLPRLLHSALEEHGISVPLPTQQVVGLSASGAPGGLETG